MKKFAAQNSFAFPYVIDATQKVAGLTTRNAHQIFLGAVTPL
jgi:hypothetical protein